MKKGIKIVLIILFLAIILFVGNIIRKACIIKNYINESEEYSKVTNFYKKMETADGIIDEYWRKDNIILYKQTSNSGTKIIYKDITSNTAWIFNNTIKENGEVTKSAKEVSEEDVSNILIASLQNSEISAKNFWDYVTIAFTTKVKSTEYNGVKCYEIYIEDTWKIYVNKDNFLMIGEVNGDMVFENIEYSLNTVTEEDVRLPVFSEYVIE